MMSTSMLLSLAKAFALLLLNGDVASSKNQTGSRHVDNRNSTPDLRKRKRIDVLIVESTVGNDDGEQRKERQNLLDTGIVGYAPNTSSSSSSSQRSKKRDLAAFGKEDKRALDKSEEVRFLWEKAGSKVDYSVASTEFSRMQDNTEHMLELEYSMSMMMIMSMDANAGNDIDQNGHDVSDDTIQPTACPSSSRGDAIENALSGLTPLEILSDPTTPQSMAYSFLTREDGAYVDPCTEEAVLVQRYALSVLYYSTGGDSWDINTSWLTEVDECSWFGILCSPADGAVTEIFLPENGLSGVIPPEIRAFTSLLHFNLFNNRIQGEIPNILSECTHLEVVDFEGNLLEGPPVVDLEGLDRLKSYRVSSNLLSGSIASGIGGSVSLTELWMASNSITGQIPESISSLVNLKTLFLYRNLLTGPLPSIIGGGNLVELQVHENLLTGSIPSSVIENVGLQYLQLDSNALTGEIPRSIGVLTNLVEFRINNNAFDGTLPASLMGLGQLVTLRVNENQLTGTIRDSFEMWNALDYADFADNMFIGTLPSSIFDIPTVRLLYFSNNNFDGVIPENFGNSPLLEDLFIDGNSISGTVPELQGSQLLDLVEFLLFGNEITGTMSPSVCQLHLTGSLEDLWADCGVDASFALECDCCNKCFPE